MPKPPTLELPKYVHRVIDGGREYFYFQRGRGTRTAGPSIRLPGGPHSIEFWTTYKEHLGGALPSGKTFNDLIQAFKLSPEFLNKRLANNSYYLDTVSSAWGDLIVANCKPKNVITLRDAYASTPVAANHLLSVLKTLINWGIPREFSETNPCIHVPKLDLKNEGGARPWPIWAYELIEKHAREDIRRAVWLARYTGQRQEDVLMMRPEHIDDDGIVVTQQKTGKVLWLPLDTDLKAALDAWDGSPYVRTPKGEPYTPERFRAAWTRLMATPAGRIRKEGFTFHGLRASSCEKFREMGCSDEEIGSITGMTPPIIKRYLRFANQKSLAKAAMRRLEEHSVPGSLESS